jgi:glycogen synthase
MQKFNACARQVKVILVNQFGWSTATCGSKMAPDMDFLDIRKGTDIEFGQSIYEPFGIAQLEPLSFGGLCVITNVCGCAGFVSKVTGGKDVPNVLVADYTRLPPEANHIQNMLSIGARERDAIEEVEAERVAGEILKRLPADARTREAFIKQGVDLAKHMSWEVVARDYLMPVLNELK